jgi:CRISPR-associated protein Cas1
MGSGTPLASLFLIEGVCAMLGIPRIVEISSPGRRLRLDRGFLAINDGHADIGKIGLDSITALMLTTPAVSVTGQALAALAERGAPVVLCGPNFRPASYLLPVTGHHAQGTRIEAQAAATLPTKKRIWQHIVRAKLTAQADALARLGLPDMPVRALVKTVASGDATNREATGAQRYWPILFGKGFKRDREEPGINALLNYGYTIVRAATARAIVAAGLHPSLGVQHKSKGSGLRLSDDLMEPFRPAVDLVVHDLVQNGRVVVSPETKAALVGVLALDYATPEGTGPLSNLIARTAVQLAQIYAGERKSLSWPKPMIPLSTTSDWADNQEDAA